MKKKTKKYASERGIEVGRGGKVFEDTDGSIIVEGDVEINPMVYAPKLVSISGDAYIYGSAPALTKVGGKAYIYAEANVNNLTTIGGRLILFLVDRVPNLTTVNGGAYEGNKKVSGWCDLKTKEN